MRTTKKELLLESEKSKDEHGHSPEKPKENDSIRTDSDSEAENSAKMSCDGHGHHSHEDDDQHDLVAAGLAQPKRKIDRKFCIIYPEDRIANSWDMLISIVLLISCFTTPISLAFPTLEEDSE